jgi:hydrogenase maturation protease
MSASGPTASSSPRSSFLDTNSDEPGEQARGAATTACVIGVGNPYRRDDGVGPAVIAALETAVPDGVTLTVTDGEPTQLLDAWAETDLAIVVDAVLCERPAPGRVHRTDVPPPGRAASTHGLGIPEAIQLAEALDRAPRRLVVYAVEAADLGFGDTLSPAVAAAVPGVVDAVLGELRQDGTEAVRRGRGPEPGSAPR